MHQLWCVPREAIVITSFQMRAARALLGIDQKTLAELAGVSLPTIQRMEASTGNVRGVVDTLTKVVDAFNRAGVDLIGEHARSEHGGRGVRLREPGPPRRVGNEIEAERDDAL
jgi:transcriptional regulator with XRE-family HTH domain